jgi:anthraniloyl-CoA monooxygenase
MTRSLRVSHASVAKRDPELARGVETMLAAGTEATRPIALPFVLGDRRARSRIVIAAEVASPTIDDALVALGGAATNAGIVVTAPRPVADLATDDAAVAWKRVVEFVHGKGALIAARLVVGPELEAAVERAAFADFDLLVLVPRAGDDAAVEQLAAAIQAARLRWRQGGWLGAVVLDRPRTRAAVVGHAAQLVRAGADLLWVVSHEAEGESETRARLPAAPLADRLRNELDVPTAIDGAGAQAPDLDAAVAAGRADLVVVARMPVGAASP